MLWFNCSLQKSSLSKCINIQGHSEALLCPWVHVLKTAYSGKIAQPLCCRVLKSAGLVTCHGGNSFILPTPKGMSSIMFSNFEVSLILVKGCTTKTETPLFTKTHCQHYILITKSKLLRPLPRLQEFKTPPTHTSKAVPLTARGCSQGSDQ